MILVFILIFFVIIISILIFSNIYIEIQNLTLSNEKLNNKKQYKVIISLYLGEYVRLLKINLNNDKMRKMYTKMQLEKIDFQKIKKDIKPGYIKLLPKLNIKITYLNTKIKIGVDNPIITSFLVAIASTLVSIGLPFVANEIDSNKYYYEILPEYNKNFYKINLNCIIRIKMVHIINVIFIILRRKSDRFEKELLKFDSFTNKSIP